MATSEWLIGGGLMSLGVIGGYWALPFSLPVLIYLVARWRDAKVAEPDPRLGLKAALGALRYIAFQVLLAGLAVGAGGAINAEGQAIRSGFGLVLPAIVALGVVISTQRRIDDAARPMASRMMAGLSFVHSALVAFATTLVLGVMLTGEAPSWDIVKWALAVAIVYIPATLLQGRRLTA